MILSRRHWIVLLLIGASCLYQFFHLSEAWALGDLLSTLSGFTTSGHYFRKYSRYSSFDELDTVRGEILRGAHLLTFALLLTSFSVHMHFPREFIQFTDNSSWCRAWEAAWMANWGSENSKVFGILSDDKELLENNFNKTVIFDENN